MSPLWPMTTRVRSTPSSLKIACCSRPRRSAANVCVVIGHPVSAMGLGARPQHPLDAGRHAGLVGGALDDAGLDPGAGDALGDVLDEQVDHRVAAVGAAAGDPPLPVVGQLVERVQAGGDDDLQVDAVRQLGDARDVAAEPERRRVEDGVDAGGLELVEPVDGVVELFLVGPQSSGTLSFISGEMMKTCSCMSTRPSSALSTGPVAVSMVGTAATVAMAAAPGVSSVTLRGWLK